MNIVQDNFSWASEFEKNQAIQWLYSSALYDQKKKDIDTWRQNAKLQLINMAENSNIWKQRNEYLTLVKKADLADLIRDQLTKQGYDMKNALNITDVWIINWFLQANPQYNDAFNKYYYSDTDAVQLGKDLWWIEKTTWDKVWDWFKNVWEWIAGFMPKFWEWVKDVLDLITTQEDAAFYNFVQDKYWTYAWALTDKDLAQARAAFEQSDKSQYTPNWKEAWVKLLEWWADIVFTSWWLKGANLLKNSLFKAWFSAAANTPVLDVPIEWLVRVTQNVWEFVNKAPVLRDLRDSLQTEQERAEFDAFVWGNIIWLFRKTKWGLKNARKTLTDAEVSQIRAWWEQAKKWNINDECKQ